MLAHMNNVQPKADLPSSQSRRYTNAMPQRNPKSQVRNLTGLYLGVDGDKQLPQRHSTLPQKCRVRGMPSRRVQTPTEERRYKKVEMLRLKEDKRGFSGNPVKNHQGRGLMSSDEMNRASMYPEKSNQFWDVTKQTNRQFTATANSGVRHLEYLNPDPNDAVSSFYPRAFDESLDEVLVQEIQAAVQLRKEVTGLIHCYNKICKGNSEALQSLLPNRPANASRPNTFQKTGFSVKSYRTPAQAEIESNFPIMEPRPKTVTGAYNDRPLVPGPYFFKMYIPPKTAGPRPSPRQPEHHHIVPAPGAGCLSHTVSKGQQRQMPHASTPTGQPRLIKTMTMQAEDIIPASPRPMCGTGTPMLHLNSNQDNKPTEKIEISLPAIQKTSISTAEETQELEMPEEGRPTATGNPVDVVPSVIIGVEDVSTHENTGSEKNAVTTEPLLKLEENRQSRHEKLESLLNEHAQIIQEISTQEDVQDQVAESIGSDKAHGGSTQDPKENAPVVKNED